MDFNNEVSLLKSLSHMNILRFIDSFAHEKYMVIVTEYCDRGDLQGYLNMQGKLPLPESRLRSII